MPIHYDAAALLVMMSLGWGPIPDGYESAPVAGTPPVEVEFSRLSPVTQKQVLEVEQHFESLFRSLLKAELSFVRRLCELDGNQRRLLSNQGESALRSSLRRFAVIQARTGFRDRYLARYAQPHRLIQEAVSELILHNLPPDRAARYQQQVSRRSEHIKTAAIQALVAALDEHLLLSAKQRRELTKSLADNWQNVWDQALPMYERSNHRLPGLPDKFIMPFLSEAQRTVWSSSRKQSFSVPRMIGNLELPITLVDFPLDEKAQPDE